jgi:uncharacterized protein YutE (UPF0331/DUF86 family)
MERKLAYLRRFLGDLEGYAELDLPARHREHYAIERLLQLLCESAADVALQALKAQGQPLAESYSEIFRQLAREGMMPEELSNRLVDACGMRNLLTHLYDSIDQRRVIEAVDPAVDLYRAFLDWVLSRLWPELFPDG